MSLALQAFTGRNHFMIDLETLGTKDDAVVVQIGVCKFNFVNDDVHLWLLDLDWSDQSGFRNIELDTVQWWMDQSDEARRGVFSPKNRVNTESALSRLSGFLGESPVIWAKPTDFDVSILRSLYDTFDVDVPWFYRDVMCLRTLMTANNYVPEAGPKIPHRADHDARAQVKYAKEIWRMMHGD